MLTQWKFAGNYQTLGAWTITHFQTAPALGMLRVFCVALCSVPEKGSFHSFKEALCNLSIWSFFLHKLPLLQLSTFFPFPPLHPTFFWRVSFFSPPFSVTFVPRQQTLSVNLVHLGILFPSKRGSATVHTMARVQTYKVYFSNQMVSKGDRGILTETVPGKITQTPPLSRPMRIGLQLYFSIYKRKSVSSVQRLCGFQQISDSNPFIPVSWYSKCRLK